MRRNEQFWEMSSLSYCHCPPGNFLGWVGRGDHPKTFLLKALFCQSTPSWLKVRGGWSSRVCWCEQSGMLVAHVIFVSAQGPNPSFFLFVQLLFNLGACWDQDLDQGLTIVS